MKHNIFSIPADKIEEVKEKLVAMKMGNIRSSEIGGWRTVSYFSSAPNLVEIPRVNTYDAIFSNPDKPTNKIHYEAYLWEKDGLCYALSFGKSHFYLRQFADSDFGLQMAIRIANKNVK